MLLVDPFDFEILRNWIFNAFSDVFMVLTSSPPFSGKVELNILFFPGFVFLFVVVQSTLYNNRRQLIPMEIQLNVLVISVVI